MKIIAPWLIKKASWLVKPQEVIVLSGNVSAI
jgi:hypothetical protein